MNRIDRLSAILIQLQTKRVIKAQEIADRFNISLRTVYRDIRALEEGGVPIGSEAGLGYYLVEGYNLPPVMLDKDEAGALILSQKLVEKFADGSISMHLENAMNKIRAVLKEADKDYIQNLENSIMVHNSLLQFTNQNQQQIMSLIQQALSAKKAIEIHYTKMDKTVSNRKLNPLGLIYYGSNWHLIGWCTLRNDYRDFRVDRIEKLEIQEERFFETDFLTLEKYIDKMAGENPLIEIKINVKNEILPHISVSKYYYGFVSEREFDHYMEMTFKVSEFEYFSRWLLMLGNGATIVSPESLKERMQELALEITEHYSVKTLT